MESHVSWAGDGTPVSMNAPMVLGHQVIARWPTQTRVANSNIIVMVSVSGTGCNGSAGEHRSERAMRRWVWRTNTKVISHKLLSRFLLVHYSINIDKLRFAANELLGLTETLEISTSD